MTASPGLNTSFKDFFCFRLCNICHTRILKPILANEDEHYGYFKYMAIQPFQMFLIITRLRHFDSIFFTKAITIWSKRDIRRGGHPFLLLTKFLSFKQAPSDLALVTWSLDTFYFSFPATTLFFLNSSTLLEEQSLKTNKCYNRSEFAISPEGLQNPLSITSLCSILSTFDGNHPMKNRCCNKNFKVAQRLKERDKEAIHYHTGVPLLAATYRR